MVVKFYSFLSFHRYEGHRCWINHMKSLLNDVYPLSKKCCFFPHTGDTTAGCPVHPPKSPKLRSSEHIPWSTLCPPDMVWTAPAQKSCLLTLITQTVLFSPTTPSKSFGARKRKGHTIQCSGLSHFRGRSGWSVKVCVLVSSLESAESHSLEGTEEHHYLWKIRWESIH